jgi:hypothetical protein
LKTLEFLTSFKQGYDLGKITVINSYSPGQGLTNRRGGHYGGGGGAGSLGNTVKAFIVGIILYFVAVAIVYTVGSSNIINNATINTQIKNVAYFMSVLGTIIGLIAGTVFVLKLLGGF